MQHGPFSEFKILNYGNQLDILASGGDIWPLSAEIDLTDSCNHNCSFCIVGSVRQKGVFLRKDTIECLLKQLAKAGVKSVVFKGGGEPMISPHFLFALERAAEEGMDVGLITNGSAPNPHFLDVISEVCSWVRISLDAATASTHRAIHYDGRASSSGFEAICENVQHLVSASATSRISVGLNFTATLANMHEIIAAAELAARLRVNYISFRNVMVVGADLPAEFWANLEEDFKRVNTLSLPGLKIVTRFQPSGFFKRRTWVHCRAPALIAIIQANGDIVACCDARGEPDYVFGNIQEETFQAIWTGDRRRDIVKSLIRPHCSEICTDRYARQNSAIDYLSGPREHSNFL